jgi:hypothetical protein
MSGPARPQASISTRFFLLLSVFAALSLSSCSAPVGWGVILWPPEVGGMEEGAAVPPAEEPSPSPKPTGLVAGDMVPVYVKSLIRKIYVVGLPDGKEKAELEQWRVQYSKGKRAARAYRTEFEECSPLYAIATRNGLELRDKPDNKADTVYRLRDFERIKLIKKVEGVIVETGGKRLPGDWYLTLASDGTRGYVFSNTLRVYDSRTGAVSGGSASPDSGEASIDVVLSKTWRPEYFKTMIENGRYDLKDFSLKYGLFFDTLKKEIKIELPRQSRRFPYQGTVELKQNLFGFEGNHVRVLMRKDDLITLEFPLPDGKTRSEIFVTIEEDIEAAIKAEESRRQAILGGILSRGRVLTSDSYGVLGLQPSRRFSWTGYGLLSPLVIPEGSGETGEIAFDG